MNLFSETIIRALCWTLLHSLWQGLILAVAAGGVMLLTRRARSSSRYIALSALVMAFLLVSGYTFLREMRLPATAGAPAATRPVFTPATAVNVPVVLAQDPTIAASRISPIGQWVQYFNAHASLVVVVWFIVTLARLLSLLSGLVYAQRIRHYRVGAVPAEWQERLGALLQRLKITRPVQLLESALIKVPVVVGWLKPAILVPVGMLTQLSADQVESILLHELAHISRRDYLFNVVQHLVDTLFFFNPALLWVSSLIRTERENCCDDVAIRETRSRRQLIEALVSFHEYQQSARGFAMGFAGEHNGMVKRVERIVHKKNHSLNAGERLLLMGGVMILCGAFITINSAKHAPEPIVVKAITKTPTVEATRIKSPSTVATHPKPQLHIPTLTDTTKKDTTAPVAGTPAMTKADVELLIKAHDHGVSTEFLADLKQLGYTVSLEQAIRLVDHGVNAEFIRSVQKEGYGKPSLESAIRLVDHGVSAEFLHDVKAQSIPDLTLEQAVELADHGVTPGFIAKWKAKSGGKLEFHDYLKLKDAGIDPS